MESKSPKPSTFAQRGTREAFRQFFWSCSIYFVQIQNKNKITKLKNKVLCLCFNPLVIVLSTTQGTLKLIYCENQLTGSYLIDKHSKVKG